MTTKHEVLALFDAHPEWSSGQVAHVLGCESGYVRATLYRNGRKLAGIGFYSGEGPRFAAAERERCARIAEGFAHDWHRATGNPCERIAAAIRQGSTP